ncbi:MAG: alpha-mannosidase, partial [Phycisphaerae bacterium]
ELACFDRQLWQLLQDAEFAFGLMLGLAEDHPRRARLLYGLNELCNVIGEADPAAVRRCRAILRPLLTARANASAARVSAIGHAHIDVAWLWPLRETVRKCGRTFSTALRYMREYPEYRFVQSQAQLYEYTRRHYRQLYEQIRRAIRRGQWIAEGAMWVEADCNITAGESLVRQLLYGKRFFAEQFGVECRILWLPDAFGYSAGLPQILKLAGVDYFLTQKLSWNELNRFPYHTFWWEGIDGSRVLAHFPPADSYNSTVKPQEMLRASRAYRERDRSDRWIVVFGHGDGGGGPTTEMLERIRRMGDCEELPRVQQESPVEFFKKLQASSDDWPVWVGELYLELHRGTYTSQARTKRNNRLAEVALREAEFLAAAVPDGLRAYPQDRLDEAWKLVLLNQFHDVLPGSSIGWVYRDSDRQYEQARRIAQAVAEEGAGRLIERIETRGSGRPVVLTNSLSWPRRAVVEIGLRANESAVTVTDENGQQLPVQLVRRGGQRVGLIQADVESMGYRTVWIRPGR